jgi:hypothetical protein
MNPDSLTENYWESYPFLCDFKRLLVKDGRVSGTIANQIFEYPLTLFDNQLDGCNFSVEQLEDSRCAANHYIVFPNPSSTGNVTIQSVYVWNPLQKIRMFGYDGRLIRELKAADTSEYLYQRVEIKGLQDGLYIIEILCNDQRYYKKVIINK